jgi:hypothetical protein
MYYGKILSIFADIISNIDPGFANFVYYELFIFCGGHQPG